MEHKEVSREQVLIILANLLREGIHGHKTVKYFNKRKKMTLFIEPEINRLELYSEHKLLLGLYFLEDNKTWDSVSRGEISFKRYNDENKVREVFERIRREKGEHVLFKKEEG